MKKILVFVVLAVFVMMPLTSFAKTAMSDSELSTVTGQKGVSINSKCMNDFFAKILCLLNKKKTPNATTSGTSYMSGVKATLNGSIVMFGH